MPSNTVIIAALATVAAISGAASGNTLAVSTFDTGDEGWIAQAGPLGTPYAVNWNPTGGVPSGHLGYQDATMQDYEWFSASSTFLGNGDFSQAVNNGGVSFDWSANIGMPGQNVQLAFVSNYAGGSILWTETTAQVGSGWSHYDFALDLTTTWLIEVGSSTVYATSADLAGVLSSVDGLYITADTLIGMDGSCWLDNPTIYSVPAPGAIALLGVASIVGTRRRRGTRS